MVFNEVDYFFFPIILTLVWGTFTNSPHLVHFSTSTIFSSHVGKDEEGCIVTGHRVDVTSRIPTPSQRNTPLSRKSSWKGGGVCWLNREMGKTVLGRRTIRTFLEELMGHFFMLRVHCLVRNSFVGGRGGGGNIIDPEQDQLAQVYATATRTSESLLGRGGGDDNTNIFKFKCVVHWSGRPKCEVRLTVIFS